MVIPVIPDNLESSFSVVDTLSPSVFTQLKNGCKYKFILQKSALEKTKGTGVSLTYPPVSAAIYGNIIHKLFEKRMKGLIPDVTCFEELWNAEVEKYRADLKSKYPLYDFENDYAKMLDAEDIAMRMTPVYSMQNGISTTSFQTSSFERPYKIPGLLYGKIDRISFENDLIEIIDYKTGNIFEDNGNVKQIYVEQLNLYALMYESVEGKYVDKLTIIDKQGNSIDVPKSQNQDLLRQEVAGVKNQINDSILNGTQLNLASPSEINCKYCECRHLCTAYWESAFLQDNFIKGSIQETGSNYVCLVLDNGSIVRITGVQKLNINHSDFYKDRHLMFLEVIPAQQTINHYHVTKNTLVFDYPTTSDPNQIYYSNYLPELHNFIKILLEKGIDISKDGGYYLLDDDGMVLAEAGLGVESRKLVVQADSISESVFRSKGYKVFKNCDLDKFINELND